MIPLALGLSAAWAGSGGPDAGGLVWTDSDETDGPSYAWLDQADDLYFLDAGERVDVDLPFAFTLYDEAFETASIGADGTLAFAGSPGSSCPADGAGWTGVAAFATVLSAVSVSTATVGDWPWRSFVVTWTGYRADAPDPVEVQLWLLEARDEVVLNFASVDVGDPALDGGAGAVIGVQGEAATAWDCDGGLVAPVSVWFGDVDDRPARVEVSAADLDTLLGETSFGYLGKALSAGDVDGDGSGELLVGARDQDAAFLHARPFAEALATLTGGDAFGAAVLLEDIDGDGVDEALVGEIDPKVAVWGWSGGLGGAVDTTSADLHLDEGSTGSLLPGLSLAAGDLDGDGRADLLVGDPTWGSGNPGRIYRFSRPGVSALAAADEIWEGSTGDRFGSALTAADLDADGAAELIVGAPYRDAGGSDAGGAYLFASSTGSHAAADALCTLTGDALGARLGAGLTVGDFDGDGILSLVLGAPTADPSPSDAGSVYVLDDPLACPAFADAVARVDGTTLAANTGSWLGRADLDGDGVDDLLASAPNSSLGGPGAGALFAWRSAGSGLAAGTSTTADADQILLGAAAGGALGTAVTVADNPAGRPTLLLAAPYAATDVTGGGRVHAWTWAPDFIDTDGDAFVDAEAGGNDCDDADPAASPDGTDARGDDVDGDCDGWIDGEIRVRDAEAGWAFDLALVGASVGDAPEDFEAYAEGEELTVSGDLAWSSETGEVLATDDVSGSAAVGTRALQAGGGDLTLTGAVAFDGLAFQLLDAGDLELQATGADGLVAVHTWTGSTDDTPGGRFVSLVFAEEVTSLRIRSASADSFGLDEVEVAWATDSDRDLDGWSDAEGDCNDNDEAISPDAEEDLSNGVDDDCDGVVDGGAYTTWADEETWPEPDPADILDFEDRIDGETLDRQYRSRGVQLDGGWQVDTEVDGTAAVGSLAARGSAALTLTFQENQQVVAFTLLDADGLCSFRGAADGWDLYSGVFAGTGGLDFVGLSFAYAVDELEIDCGADLVGLDDLILHEVGREDNDGDGRTEAEGDCDDDDATISPDAEEEWYDGVDADCAGDDDFDADGDGWSRSADCDDGDTASYPAAEDPPYDGIDADCAGDSDYDWDGDGHDSAEWGGDDCDDEASEVSPSEAETWYDGVDSDCAGDDDYDADGDGVPYGGSGGGGESDCDDGDASVNPYAEEVWYDGVDGDCSGADRGDYDQDGDGHAALLYGGDDCDDTRADVYPEAGGETCYDGVDTDCAGDEDYDCDGDGHVWDLWGGDDCDDGDATVFPGMDDPLGDGVDADCDGAPEYDGDRDGWDSAEWGGPDCDDADPEVHPGVDDACYDGLDPDCDGADDFDCDGDGARPPDWGGEDCDDTDASLHPGAADFPYDGVDHDCDGADEWDQDGDGLAADWYGGPDCDDLDASVYPGAEDLCHDGIDSDCGGEDDDDCDGDGWAWDCDEADPGIHPGAAEIPDDGVDQDCDGEDAVSCTDCDGDGWAADTDCDDADAGVHPGAEDAPYDGIDADCAGGDDDDADADGHAAEARGGDDCDDADATVHPDAADGCGRGDEDCDGRFDEDCALPGDTAPEPADTGFVGDTALPDPRDTATTDAPAGEDPIPAKLEGEAPPGCGCHGGAGAAWLGLVAALGGRRRRG